MPTYEYGCGECGHQWEAIQRISADPLKACPNCGKDSAKRQISGGQGFLLKGGGWYSDLYSSAGSASKAASSSTASDSSSSDSSSSDSYSSSASSDLSEPGVCSVNAPRALVRAVACAHTPEARDRRGEG